jgi:triphosphoribosyl-dephospho-CoA synthase
VSVAVANAAAVRDRAEVAERGSALDRVETAPERRVDSRRIGARAVRCLLLELETWPKPGLVSHIDSGSHVDMDADTFRRSAAAIAPYLDALADAGARGCAMARLRVIGLEAEAAMLAATSGINTHRGAIFGVGLLCAAAGARASGYADPGLSLGAMVSRTWATGILDGPVPLHSHGSRARRRFGAGGARMEAAMGFPSVYEIGLPALRKAGRAVGEPDEVAELAEVARASEPPEAARTVEPTEAARVETCFALIAHLEDTNLLHRGGLAGLRFARRTALDFLAAGGVRAPDWKTRARSAHERFIARRLSPGGSADLLAMTLFVDAQEKDL